MGTLGLGLGLLTTMPKASLPWPKNPKRPGGERDFISLLEGEPSLAGV